LANFVWKKFRKEVEPERQQLVLIQTLEQAAAMPKAEFAQKADEIVAQAMPESSPNERQAAAEYLKLIPDRIRSTFRRNENPQGTTVPAKWGAYRSEDLLAFLPTRLPKYKEGDVPPEASRWILTERLGKSGRLAARR
jgi:hypothetical protein